MAVRIRPLDRTALFRPGAALAPDVAARQVADHARELVAAAAAANAAALGRPAPHADVVNGVPGAAYETVRPGGSIVALFDLGTDCLSWILDQLKAAAPVLSGEYRASIAIYADGVAVDTPAAASAAGEVAFVSTVPYARKIERGESPKAPHGVFQAVAALAAARYGNVARIRYAFREPVGGATALEAWASTRSARDASRQQRQQYLKDVRQPAVVVSFR